MEYVAIAKKQYPQSVYFWFLALCGAWIAKMQNNFV
jgi:hypothetical protein